MPFNNSEQILPTIEHGVNRQPRFGYIPLFGLLLANVLSNSVLAKYAPLGSLRLSYEPLPWLHKPAGQQQTHDSYHYWHPLENSYRPSSVLGSSENGDQHIHHHHHVPAANQQQIVNIHERPTEIIISDGDTVSPDQNDTTPVVIIEDNPPIPMFKNTLEKPIQNPLSKSRSISPKLFAFLANTTVPSSKKVKRGTSGYTKTRKNNKYISQKKRRPNTTPEYYYDSYEDITTTKRYKPKRTDATKRRKPVVDSYEESESSISQSYSDLSTGSQDYEYDSYEITTKPHKRRRITKTTTAKTTRPKKIKNKYGTRKRQKLSVLDDEEDFDDIEYDTEGIEPSTSTTQSWRILQQELLLRQQQQLHQRHEDLLRRQELLQRQQQETTTTQESTTESSTTSSTSTTTTPLTILIQGNVSTPNDTNSMGYDYGYGPSHGNENISITYGPPSSADVGFVPGFSPVYNAPNPSYGVPTYSPPRPSYGPPSPSYGPPSSSYEPSSNTYGVSSSGAGGYSPNVHGYYQVPFNDWYSNELSKNSIVKKVHDIIGFNHDFN